MATKKSELYSSLWEGCDALRGAMDASQYKDYVLVMLFLKYVSDKAKNDSNALIIVPKGCYYDDIIAAKGQKNIGEKIDTVIGKIAKENDLEKVIDVISFNDEEKLGKGKEMVDRLSDLVAIFENPAMDFSKNRAEGDDLLGDAYEYLMRHFATESGKSKGQFYTSAEISRVMAKVIGIKNASNKTSFYDPTCGSGSLLLKAVEEADGKGSIYGQEKEIATAALAKMNMILHNNPLAEIRKGQSTLSHPLFEDKNGNMQTFDYVVANPPFSLKNWTQGFNPFEDEHDRFTGFGIPPEKNGDYAFLLHIVKSLKSTGKAAVILPHGVLFRGNAEADIRKALIKKGYIKGIIGLPANLFYGTGIPACIIVIDKENANDRKGIFLIDASKGYMKDGNKNRLREQDIHKIVDTFNKQEDVNKYSRFVPISEISDAKNDYNLNIPRYIDSQETEDIQDIEAHLLGDIPEGDIDALQDYWKAYPSIRAELFGKSKRKGYSTPKVEKDEIKQTIFNHPEFTGFTNKMQKVFKDWEKRTSEYLTGIKTGVKPKQLIYKISEDLLHNYEGKPLLDAYDVYQHLLNYWNETMQDDCYLIAVDGWKAEPYRIIEKNKKTGKETDKGWTCDLVPPTLVIDKFLAKEKKELDKIQANKDALEAELASMEEEHGAEDGLFSDLEKINKANATKRLKEVKGNKNVKEEVEALEKYLNLCEEISKLISEMKKLSDDIDKLALAQYKKLSVDDIKQLVIQDKWMSTISRSINGEMERVSQSLTQRVKELMERYETPLPKLNQELKELESKVNFHLEKMGLVWN
jgi:type I restriction enzyme M protein